MPPAIFLGELADLNSFRGIIINPDALQKRGLGPSRGYIEGQEGRPPPKREACCLLINLFPRSRQAQGIRLGFDSKIYIHIYHSFYEARLSSQVLSLSACSDSNCK